MGKVIEMYDMYDEVNSLKECEQIYVEGSDIELKNTLDNFDRQNNKVFMINLHILLKFYEEEFLKIREKYGEFKLDQYYELLETINLPKTLHDMYSAMPEMINSNKILSYATDIPSYMGMKRN